MHFSLNNDVYVQIDDSAMGLPLGPVIVNIFMVEPENVLVLKLNNHVKKRRRLWMTPLFTSSMV